MSYFPIATSLPPGATSIRQKLNRILIVTTVLALLFAGIALVMLDLRSHIQTLEDDLGTQAEIIGLASTSALVFDDATVAAENLSVMQAQRNLRIAALYDARGRLFATFIPGKTPMDAVPRQAEQPNFGVDMQWVDVWRPVMSRNEVIGTVYLQVKHNMLRRVLEYIAVLFVVLTSSLLAALLVSNRLQASVTGPLLAISGVARQILTGKDFTLRAEKKSDDEIGTLVELFNAMLDELGTRSAILERANDALRRSDDRYQLAVRGSSAGMWDWDMSAKTTFYSPRFKTLLGYSHDEFPDVPESLGDVLHDDDRSAVRKALREHLTQGKPYQIECRLRLKTGEWRWFFIAGMAQKDEHGEAFRMAGSVIDITGRKAAEQILREANRAKDEFLATLAHELRNPLAPIRTSLQILKKGDANGASSTRAREIMERQLAHMVRLIDDLLDISRINSGKISIERSRIALASAIVTAIEISRPLVEGKSQKLSVSLPVAGIELMADGTRLAQSLGNLLNNASKYTPERGAIQLAVSQDGPTAVIDISDDGVGIPQEMLETIFALFTQVGRTLDRSQGGLGIGLYLVRSLIELHGGSVTASSAGAGLGSTFRVRIPCLLQSSSLPGPQNSDSSSLVKNAALKVLVVDDNVDAAETLLALLEMDGHVAHMVHDGAEVLQAAESLVPDVVLLDIGLPGMSGYEVARQLRRDPRFSRTVLVAVTGWGSEKDRRQALDAGFDRHLTKPVDLQVMDAILKDVARNAKNGNE